MLQRMPIAVVVLGLMLAAGCRSTSNSDDVAAADEAEAPEPTQDIMPSPSVSPVTPAYQAPLKPDFWLINSSGIGLSPQTALPGKTLALLYSSWCPNVRGSLPKLLPILREGAPGFRIVGIFANGELSQLSEETEFLRISEATQKSWKRLLARDGIGTGLVEDQYAYGVDQKFPRYRMPRMQWEHFGAHPGGLKMVCFDNGEQIACPQGFDKI
jgi:hypothetical protein